MTEQLKPDTFEILDPFTTSDRLSEGIPPHAATALQGLKHVLLARLEEARLGGHVYWNRDEIVDRPVDIDGLAGKVRYIPTFAYRKAVYDQRPACPCSLCGVLESRDNVITLPDKDADSDFMDKFNDSFALGFNNFPYFDGQLLLTVRQHRELFTRNQYGLIFDFMERTKFAGAAIQLHGSGATIPEHAHISLFDEVLPIFSSEYRPLKEKDGVVVSASTEHPSVCYKIDGESKGAKLDRTTAILDELLRLGLSFNLYFDSQSSAYVIPRTNRRARSIDMKVGSPLAAGVYYGYVEYSNTSDIELLKQEIWQRCQEITGKELAAALKETTVQGEDPAAIL
ncbi:MAG: hypothetical protein V4702_00820 [Patescibacteria group bacterium]